MILHNGAECGGYVPWCGWKPGGKPATAQSVARLMSEVFDRVWMKEWQAQQNEPSPWFAALTKVAKR